MAVEKNPRPDGEYLNSLARGLAVLRSFGRSRPKLTLSELAALTELNPAVVRRCLNTLMHLGYVGKSGKDFFLRPEVFSLGSAYLESMNLDEVVRPALEQVRERTGNSSGLAVLSGHDAVFLAYLTTKLLSRIVAGVGTRFPAFATSAGRVLLAYQQAEFLERFFAETPLEEFTDRTVTSPERLRDILRETREQGYCITVGELDFGILSAAVPVRSPEGQVIACVAGSNSTASLSREEIERTVVPELREAAREIETQLQFCPMLVQSLSA